MPDEIDRVQEILQVEDDAWIALARRHAHLIPKGEPGICSDCREYSPRLVAGRCAPCRDYEK